MIDQCGSSARNRAHGTITTNNGSGASVDHASLVLGSTQYLAAADRYHGESACGADGWCDLGSSAGRLVQTFSIGQC